MRNVGNDDGREKAVPGTGKAYKQPLKVEISKIEKMLKPIIDWQCGRLKAKDFTIDSSQLSCDCPFRPHFDL